MKKKIGIVMLIIILLILCITIYIGKLIINDSATIDSGWYYSGEDIIFLKKKEFNNLWFKYAEKQSGFNIKELINKIISNNNENYDVAGKIIRIDFIGTNETIIKLGENYKVEDINPSDFKIGMTSFSIEEEEKFVKNAVILKNMINLEKEYMVLMRMDIETQLISKITIVEEGAVESIENYTNEYYQGYEEQRLEYEKEVIESEKKDKRIQKLKLKDEFLEKNASTILILIKLGIVLDILIIVAIIILVFKKRKNKKAENNE